MQSQCAMPTSFPKFSERAVSQVMNSARLGNAIEHTHTHTQTYSETDTDTVPATVSSPPQIVTLTLKCIHINAHLTVKLTEFCHPVTVPDPSCTSPIYSSNYCCSPLPQPHCQRFPIELSASALSTLLNDSLSSCLLGFVCLIIMGLA